MKKQGEILTELEKLTAKWQKILKLQDWVFHLKLRDPINGNVLSRIERYPHRKEAIIWFNPKLHKRTKTNLESTIIHELLHAKLFDWTELIQRIVKSIDSIERMKIFTELVRTKGEEFCYEMEKFSLI